MSCKKFQLHLSFIVGRKRKWARAMKKFFAKSPDPTAGHAQAAKQRDPFCLETKLFHAGWANKTRGELSVRASRRDK